MPCWTVPSPGHQPVRAAGSADPSTSPPVLHTDDVSGASTGTSAWSSFFRECWKRRRTNAIHFSSGSVPCDSRTNSTSTSRVGAPACADRPQGGRTSPGRRRVLPSLAPCHRRNPLPASQLPPVRLRPEDLWESPSRSPDLRDPLLRPRVPVRLATGTDVSKRFSGATCSFTIRTVLRARDRPVPAAAETRIRQHLHHDVRWIANLESVILSSKHMARKRASGGRVERSA